MTQINHEVNSKNTKSEISQTLIFVHSKSDGKFYKLLSHLLLHDLSISREPLNKTSEVIYISLYKFSKQFSWV